MTIEIVIKRLENIANHAIHTVEEKPFIMSLDDGIAIKKAIKWLTAINKVIKSISEYYVYDHLNDEQFEAIMMMFDKHLTESEVQDDSRKTKINQ